MNRKGNYKHKKENKSVEQRVWHHVSSHKKQIQKDLIVIYKILTMLRNINIDSP